MSKETKFIKLQSQCVLNNHSYVVTTLDSICEY